MYTHSNMYTHSPTSEVVTSLKALHRGLTRRVMRNGKVVKQQLDEDQQPLKAAVVQLRGDWKFQRAPCLVLRRCVHVLLIHVT